MPYLVAKPEDRFSRDEAHIISNSGKRMAFDLADFKKEHCN